MSRHSLFLQRHHHGLIHHLEQGELGALTGLRAVRRRCSSQNRRRKARQQVHRMPDAGRRQAVFGLAGGRVGFGEKEEELTRHTITVFPLYCMM